jgi:hypothetical protein
MLANVFWWAKRLVIIGLALACAYFYARWQGERADHANTRTAAAAAALKSAADAATTTQQLQRDKDHALTQAAKRAQANRLDADGARTELDSLRHAIATRPADPGANTCAARDDRANPAPELLGHCAAALTDLAATADRLHADRMTLWDAWPRPAPAPD